MLRWGCGVTATQKWSSQYRLNPCWVKVKSRVSAGTEAEPYFSPCLSKAINKSLPLPHSSTSDLNVRIKALGESSFFVHGQAAKSRKPETASLSNQSHERRPTLLRAQPQPSLLSLPSLPAFPKQIRSLFKRAGPPEVRDAGLPHQRFSWELTEFPASGRSGDKPWCATATGASTTRNPQSHAENPAVKPP